MMRERCEAASPSVYSRHLLGEENSPPQKTYDFPKRPPDSKLCALSRFWAGAMNYKYIMETFF